MTICSDAEQRPRADWPARGLLSDGAHGLAGDGSRGRQIGTEWEAMGMGEESGRGVGYGGCGGVCDCLGGR